jgi:transcription initiation factor TFIIIB Brf1 subunit/transcription initiation factor TFIIB
MWRHAVNVNNRSSGASGIGFEVYGEGPGLGTRHTHTSTRCIVRRTLPCVVCTAQCHVSVFTALGVVISKQFRRHRTSHQGVCSACVCVACLPARVLCCMVWVKPFDSGPSIRWPSLQNNQRCSPFVAPRHATGPRKHAHLRIQARQRDTSKPEGMGVVTPQYRYRQQLSLPK